MYQQTIPPVYFTHELFVECWGPLWRIQMLKSGLNGVKHYYGDFVMFVCKAKSATSARCNSASYDMVNKEIKTFQVSTPDCSKKKQPGCNIQRYLFTAAQSSANVADIQQCILLNHSLILIYYQPLPSSLRQLSVFTLICQIVTIKKANECSKLTSSAIFWY